MGDSWSPGCAYTGSPNLDLGANDPLSPVSVDPWALTQILADDSEDIDTSDYGNDSDFESEVSADSCHNSDSSSSESDAAKPAATQPHSDTRTSSRGQVHGHCHGTGRGAQRGRGAATNVGPGANRDDVDSDNSSTVDLVFLLEITTHKNI